MTENIKHVLQKPYKRKWPEKTSQKKIKRKPENQKFKQKDNRCGQCEAPNWTRQHICPARTAECKTIAKEKVHYLEKAFSSAEEGNWNYDQFQKFRNAKHKKGVYYAILLVYNVQTKFIIDFDHR